MWKILTRKLKETNIDWIGEVPENWEISTIGSHYTERTDKVSDLDYIPLSVTKSGIVPQLEIAAKSSNHDNRKLVLKDDFVINSRSDRKMSAGISSIDGSVSVINTVLYSNTIDRNYTKYLLKNYAFAEEFYKWGTGIVDDLWSTKWLKMKNIPIPVPSSEKQKQIGSVIDSMVQNTNNIINGTKESISELKKYKQSLITESVTKGLDSTVEMKDSGIEWIGKIPKHWQTIKMKYLLSTPLLYGANESGIPYQEDLPRYIRITDILNNNKLSDNNKLSLSLEKAKSFFLKENDILFARSGASVGKTFLISKENVNDTFAGYLIKASFKDNVNAKYIFLFTQSYAFENWKNAITIQSTIQNIGANRYNNLIISLPTYEEQQQIIQYLDNKTSAIDNIIADKTKVIEELENYKKSLIYEYVTGKKEV
ncbi:restriction endonuclease subunit S [Staphylococcus sp. HMSC068H08]|nr:restriction endonuclease subunit S [Staphylococcus sp. HMSC068H08]OFV28610.1 restriction endonuclease subunit S [Staphylococcus sp. HMSC14D10]TRM05940.1 restriction endonuclease subunit S [Staphylococcus hominis]